MWPLFFILDILFIQAADSANIMNAKILLPETCSAVVKTSFGSVGVWTPFEKIKAIHIFPGIFLEKTS